MTRSQAQRSAYTDLERNDQSPAISPKATCVLAYAHNALTGAETCA
ncbi:Malolactic regulator [Lacticaseibacillus rhamnosus]|nr:Malolactic regulator [Lacticaseibacillus rhamnosus]OXT08246.1 Malolactic regulator [Lacticaseibacillus rhamnosus]PCL26453.1 Malolactic regulator [Lacticaseibacillus rhamnosus]